MRRRAAALAVVAVLALLAATARYIVWPETDPVRRADAVVLFAGGEGERLAEARRLMARRVAPLLAISNGRDPNWPQANRLCEGGARFAVLCFQPEPNRTRGEARAVRRLARERGWRSVVVVTSTYHVTRARLLVERCYDGELRVVGARLDCARWRASVRSGSGASPSEAEHRSSSSR